MEEGKAASKLPHPKKVPSTVTRPSIGSLLFGAIPFVGVCFSVSLWDRVDPMVLGLPFNFFWLLSWLVLTPVCLSGAYRLEMRRFRKESYEGKPR